MLYGRTVSVDDFDSERERAGYYGQQRSDLVANLPRPVGRVLDLGCGEGGTAAGLRAAGATWISGVELHASAAARASEVQDETLIGRIEDVLDQLQGPFDTILLYDVLEHLPDPVSVLVALQGQAAPGTRLQVSVPNARHWSLVRDLVARGTFGYQDSGHRDVTHLRWFTRADLESLLRETGWAPEPRSHPALHGRHARLHRLTRGGLAEFTFWQWVVLALRDESSGSSQAYLRPAAPSFSAK